MYPLNTISLQLQHHTIISSNSFPSIVDLVKVVCVTTDQDIAGHLQAMTIYTTKVKIRLALLILYNGKRRTRRSSG